MEPPGPVTLEFSAHGSERDARLSNRAGVGPDQFEAAFGESIGRTLDLDTWRPGGDLAEVYERVETEVAAAITQEERVREPFRQAVFPRVVERAGAPAGAGLYRASLQTIEQIHRGLLFSGAVEACDGTIQRHDTLPVTFYQVGISLVSYKGDQGTWSQRLFRRDLRLSGGDPVSEAVALIERRAQRDGEDQADPRDSLGEMAQRAIMEYAERAILLGVLTPFGGSATVVPRL